MCVYVCRYVCVIKESFLKIYMFACIYIYLIKKDLLNIYIYIVVTETVSCWGTVESSGCGFQ